MRNDPVALQSSSSLAAWLASSQPSSTPLDSKMWAGGISSRTAAGLRSRLHSSTLCFLKRLGVLLRNSLSVSHPGLRRIT